MRLIRDTSLEIFRARRWSLSRRVHELRHLTLTASSCLNSSGEYFFPIRVLAEVCALCQVCWECFIVSNCSIMEFEEIVFSPSLVELSLIGKTKVLSGGSWTRVTLFSSWLLNCCLNFSHQQNRTKVTLFGLRIHCVSSFSLLVLLFLGCVASYSCLWSLLSVVWLFLSIVGQENEKNCLLPRNASCLQHEMINNMEKEIEQESPEAVTAENESTEKSLAREKNDFLQRTTKTRSQWRERRTRGETEFLWKTGCPEN